MHECSFHINLQEWTEFSLLMIENKIVNVVYTLNLRE